MNYLFLLSFSYFCFVLSVFGVCSDFTIRDIMDKYDINGFEKEGGTDKDTLHSYVEPYTELLRPFKDRECNILEIGTQYGGSALIWHDYLPKSKLFLIDMINVLHPKILEAMDPNRYCFDIMDAYTPDAVDKMRERCPAGFDVILDDGDHAPESQLFVLESYLSLLRKNGILVIEDIPNYDRFITLKNKVRNNFGVVAESRDLRRIKGRFDDFLLIVRRIN